MTTPREEYPGDGSTVTFSVPFPYILKDHVKVYLDGVLKAVTSDYVWSGSSAITMNTAPGANSTLVIQRETPNDTRLVNFTNGANLTEDDLNLAMNQVFYLEQEMLAQFARVVAGQYTLPSSTLVDDAVSAVLSSSAALAVQQRVADIDQAGEDILDLMDWRNVLGSLNAGRTAFVLDTNAIYIDSESGDTVAERLSILAAADTTIAASVTSEAAIRASADGALEALYGVSLNVNGFITGFVQNNNGTSGSFDILANTFRVVDPGPGAGATPVSVFTIESGNVLLRNLYLDHLILGAAGAISVGKTSAADTTNGIWLGTDGSTHYDFHIGNSSNFLHWDGSAGTLALQGALTGTFTLGAGDIDSISASYSGFSSNPTVGFSGSLIGLTYHIYVAPTGSQGTSNSTSFSIDGFATNPLSYGFTTNPFKAIDNGAECLAIGVIGSSGTMTLQKWNGTTWDSSGWTASGTKGIAKGQVITHYYNPYLWA